jgi:tetratricopeptide (TPR) repeat protein
MSGEIARARGEYERAIECYQRAQLAGRATGFPFMEAIVLGSLGIAYHALGDAFLDRVAECHAQTLELLEAPGGPSGAGTAWVDVGFCLLAKGELERAEDLFQKGLTMPTTQGLLNRPMFLAGSAMVSLARQNTEKAATDIAEARTLVEQRAMKHVRPFVTFVEALVSAARGEAELAARQFAQAEALALEMRMRPLIWQTRSGAANALSALGRMDEAEAKRREARLMVDEIASLFADRKLRESFVEGALRKIG